MGEKTEKRRRRKVERERNGSNRNGSEEKKCRHEWEEYNTQALNPIT